MLDKPSQEEIDSAIKDLALRELDDKPVGSVVMVNEVIGYKKMGLWWTFRMYGLRSVLKECWKRVGGGW